jgi:hypothetical protein
MRGKQGCAAREMVGRPASGASGRIARSYLLAAMVGAALLARARGSTIDIGCGGFVRASDSLGGAKPDLSPVRVQLIALDGTVKAETECAPNGYFYLPMYDPGAYVVRLEGPPVRGSLAMCLCARARGSARGRGAALAECVCARLIVACGCVGARGLRVGVAACPDAVVARSHGSARKSYRIFMNNFN